MIIAFAGLPGTGKSTLAVALARHLEPVLLLDKDRVRQSLFTSEHTLYTRGQDDFCVEKLYDTAAWQLRHLPTTTVILDGRSYSRAYQVQRLRTFATGQRRQLLLIECVCHPDLATERLTRDQMSGGHPAGNRTPELYRRLRAEADPIPGPKLLLDTSKPLGDNINHILRRVTAEPAAPTIGAPDLSPDQEHA